MFTGESNRSSALTVLSQDMTNLYCSGLLSLGSGEVGTYQDRGRNWKYYGGIHSVAF